MSTKILLEQLADGDEPAYFGEVVHSTGWRSEGKYGYIQEVIKVQLSAYGIDDGYYRCSTDRSGSYFTDYEYGDWNVEKVEPYEETITRTMYRKVEGE